MPSTTENLLRRTAVACAAVAMGFIAAPAFAQSTSLTCAAGAAVSTTITAGGTVTITCGTVTTPPPPPPPPPTTGPKSWSGTQTDTWGTLNMTLNSATDQVVVGTPLAMSLTSNLTGTFAIQATSGVCTTDSGGYSIFPQGAGGTNNFNVSGTGNGTCYIGVYNGATKVVEAILTVSGATTTPPPPTGTGGPAVPSGCSAIPADASFQTIPYQGRLFWYLNSGQVGYANLPTPTLGAGGQVTLGETTTSTSATVEMAINPCPGVYDSSNPACYIKTSNTNFVPLQFAVAQQSGINKNNAAGYGICWAAPGDSPTGQYFVNLRYTYNAGGSYAFAVQWNNYTF